MTIDQLQEKDKGTRIVIYRDSFTKKPEQGVVTSWNDGGVFVQFQPGGTSQRCDFSDVEFLHA